MGSLLAPGPWRGLGDIQISLARGQGHEARTRLQMVWHFQPKWRLKNIGASRSEKMHRELHVYPGSPHM